MKILLENNEDNLIDIIPELAEWATIWLEGYNGIGKTMAARFLEIAFGEHIFPNPNELMALRSSVKEIRIICRLIDSDEELLAVIQPKKWSLSTDRLRILDNHATYHLGSSEITRNEALEKISVKIVKGNETLRSQTKELVQHVILWINDLLINSKQTSDELEKFKRQFLEEFEMERIFFIERELREILFSSFLT